MQRFDVSSLQPENDKKNGFSPESNVPSKRLLEQMECILNNFAGQTSEKRIIFFSKIETWKKTRRFERKIYFHLPSTQLKNANCTNLDEASAKVQNESLVQVHKVKRKKEFLSENYLILKKFH